jgi:hypothetical protein
MIVTTAPDVGEQLRATLRHYHRDVLRRMAAATGLSAEALQKEQLVQALADHLARPETVDAALSRLDPAERHVLAVMVALGGYAATAALREHLQRATTSGDVEPTAAKLLQDEAAFDGIVGRLAQRGLVFNDAASGSLPARDLQPAEHIFVSPAAMERAGRHEEEVPASFEAPPAGTVTLSMPPDALLRDCYFYWSGVRDHPAAVTSRGLVAKRDLLRLGASLSIEESLDAVPTEDRAGRTYFLRCLLLALGLLRQEGSSLRARETNLFHQSGSERAALIFAEWREATWWSELSRIDGLRVTVHRMFQRRLARQVVMARGFILRLLRGLPAGRWYSFDLLDERTRLAKADFLIGHDGPPFYLGRDIPESGLDLSITFEWPDATGLAGQSEWDGIEGRFLRAVIAEPLFWMGGCDLVLAGGRPLAFRLTPTGQRLLHGEETSARQGAAAGGAAGEPAAGRVIVQPNFDILVYEPVSPHILAELDRFAVRQGTGNVLHYHLSRSSLYRAQQQGLDAASVIALLEQAGGRELPQNVRYSLLDWQRQHERITLHEGVALCQVADPALLAALLAAAPPAPPELRRLAPDVAMLPSPDLDTLRRALEGRGYLARALAGVDEAEYAQPDLHSLGVTAEGEIAVEGPLASLYLRGELERFADRAGGDGAAAPGSHYALTPASLRRATEEGLTVATIVAWLESRSGAVLPDALVDRLKSWAGHYGTITIEQRIVVRLETAELLAELLADRCIGPLLTGLAPSTGLASVAAENLESLRQALAEKGIAVEDHT